MESLSYPFEGRGLLFTDDAEFQVDGLSRSRNLSKKRDGEPLHFPIRDAIEGMGFMEPHLPDSARNSVFSNHVLGSSADDSMDHTVTLNSLMEFGTRVSSSANRAGDEKLAGNLTEPNGNRFSIDSSVLPSPEPSVSAKRARITSSHSQIPTCQVHGCNKDLTSSKGYHKRHKVCDVHSKTAVVIVNGIRQRFCQQCSRFHILSEFDEGKRSCRKRLAGHNERRRKPQFHPHLGSTYYTMDAAKTSLLFSRILPGGFLGLTCNEPPHFKLEEEPNQISQLAPHMKFGESVHLHGMGGQHPAKNCLDSTSPIPELYVGSNSSCALSLLSAQSQNSLINSSAGMSMAHPLIPPPNHPADLSTLQNSTKHTPKNVAFSSSGAERKEIPMAPHAIFSADIKPLQESDLKSYQSPEGANTVDLLELSLHLQRVERQKYDTQIRR